MSSILLEILMVDSEPMKIDVPQKSSFPAGSIPSVRMSPYLTLKFDFWAKNL